MPSRSRVVALAGASMAVVGASLLLPPVRRAAHPLLVRVRGARSIDGVLERCAPAVVPWWTEALARAEVAYPPWRVVLVAFKEERRLEVFATDGRGLRHVATMPILGASGRAGPKRREGDRQVPEGIYRIESLNPNSRFHLSLRLDYPNDFDRAMAARDGRAGLGSNIFIHGGRASIGCLAIGDDAIERLFVLAADTGLDHVEVVIAPHDLRTRPRPTFDDEPKWYGDLCARIEARLAALPAP